MSGVHACVQAAQLDPYLDALPTPSEKWWQQTALQLHTPVVQLCCHAELTEEGLKLLQSRSVFIHAMHTSCQPHRGVPTLSDHTTLQFECLAHR